MYQKIPTDQYIFVSPNDAIQNVFYLCSLNEKINWFLIKDTSKDENNDEILGCISKKSLQIAVSYNLLEIAIIDIADHPPSKGKTTRHVSLRWDEHGTLYERTNISIQSDAPTFSLSFPPNMIDWCKKIGNIAQTCETSLFLVGGAVRDMMLHQKAEDLDFLFFGDRYKFAEQLVENYGGALHSEDRFGAFHWTTDDGITFDFTQARSETYNSIAELPVVQVGTLFDDLCRRDFTPNTMAVCMVPPFFGSLLDPFGGKKDLQAGIFRVLHGLSFFQDPTRIFRMARYCGRYQNQPDQHSRFLAKKASNFGVCSHLSAKRIGTEITKIFLESTPSLSFQHLSNWGLLSAVFPTLSDLFLNHLKLLEQDKELRSLLHCWMLFSFHLSSAERKSNIKLVSEHKGMSTLFSTIPSEITDIQSKLPTLKTVIEVGWLLIKKNPSSLKLLLLVNPAIGNYKLFQWWQEKGKDITNPIQAKELILHGFPKGPIMGKVLRRSQELAWLEHDRETIISTLQQEFEIQ